MTKSTSATPRKKRRIGKIIAIILCILILPLIVGYFVVTSAAFFKKVILPQAGKAMNSTITAADVSISPFSQVILKNLEVKPNGKETLFKADEIRAHYSLRDIIGGKITVSEVAVVSPVITIVEAADGSSNLDPIEQAGGDTEKPSKPEDKNKSAKPLNLNIQNISLKNALVQQTKNLPGGGHETAEISNLNFSIDRLSNGQPGKMNLAADIRMDNVPSANNTNAVAGSMRAKLAGDFDYKLTVDIQPESAKGKLRLDVSEATGQMADLAKLAAILDCDLTPTDIRQANLHFEQSGNALGELRVSGPFSAANMEGKLKVELSSIDRRVLNLAGAASGIDFNSTVISSANEIVISQKGKAISVNGQLNVNQLSLTKKAEKKTTPVLDLVAAYELSVDQNAKSALIQKFNLDGTQNGKKILHSAVSKPMTISWGGANATPEDATLQIAVTDLNLEDWKSFVGETAPSGNVNATVNLVSAQAGKQLSVDVISSINALSAKFGSNQISNADIELKTKVSVADMKKVSLANYSVQLSQAKQPALTLSGSGTLDLESNDADIKANIDGALSQLFKVVVMPDLEATSGDLKFNGQITQHKEAKTVKGNLALVNFSGSYAGSPVNRFGMKFDTDIEMNPQDLQIKKLSGDLQQSGKTGGTFDVSGHYKLEKKTGSFGLKISDLNQNALRPFLAKSLGEKQLVTISINVDTTADLRDNGLSIKGNVDLKDFVVRDPKKPKDDAPLATQIQLDGGMNGQVFDLKQFQIALSPTVRAKNLLNITGQFDLSKTNAMKGKVLVQSDGLDVTPFYDLYAAQPTNAAANPTPTEPVPQNAPVASNKEPEPIHWPVEQIVAEVDIGKFFLREIEIKDWRATTKIEDSHVVLNPFQLSLNGRPVKMNADLNLGVKGYVYDFSASLDGIPAEPLANSFMPDKKGAYQGTLFADAKIKGAGMTGVNLKKSLSAQANLNFTNAVIQVVDLKNKGFLVDRILVPIATFLHISEIANAPISWVGAHLDVADGKINLKDAMVASSAYRGTVRGIIPMADVLTNSPLNKIPVGIELQKAVAEKAKMGGGTVSDDGNFVKLPNLVSLSGTLGKPKPEFDYKGLAALTLQTGSGYIKGDAGKILKGLGGVLGSGQQTNSTNSGTNQSPQSEQLINDALDFFKKKKKK